MTDNPSVPAGAGKSRLFSRDFTLVVLGQIISLLGNAILRFALPLYIYYETGSETLFGLVSASAFIPMIILSPIGGIIADRVNKQRIMVVLDFFTAALTAAFLLLSGRVSPVPLFVVTLMLLYGISGAYSPAVQASIPILAGGENLMPANAVVNLVNSLSSLLGPIIGAVLFSRYGLGPIVAVSGACFFLSAVMELFIRIPHKKQNAQSSVWATVRSDLSESMSFMRREQPVILRGLIIVAGINLFMSSLMMIGMPVLITGTLGLSTELYGTSSAILAAGGLAGGILAGVAGKRLRVRNAWILLLLSGAGLLPIGIAFLLNAPVMAIYVILTAVSFLMMTCATLFSIQMLAFVQNVTPTELVGKVVACVMAISIAAQPVGQALYGFLFQQLGHIPWAILLGGGVITLLISAFSRSTFAGLEQ